MKLVVALVALAICIGFRNVQGGPTPGGGLVAYPWTEWLKLRPPPAVGGPSLLVLQLAQLQAAAAAAAAAATPAPSASAEAGADTLTPEVAANYLKRAILPAPSKKKTGKEKSEPTDEDVSTTKKPKLIEVGDFWSPPSVAPNVTDVVSAMDPAFWAAKKTMFISRLFAALAKQVLNSTGEVTTTTETPNAALLREIDTVLLSDVARSIVEEAGPPPPTTKELAAQAKLAKKESKKATKKTAKTKTKGPPAFVLAAKAKAAAAVTTEAPAPVPVTEAAPTPAPHPTLDYSSLAKALLS